MARIVKVGGPMSTLICFWVINPCCHQWPSGIHSSQGNRNLPDAILVACDVRSLVHDFVTGLGLGSPSRTTVPGSRPGNYLLPGLAGVETV